MPPNRKTGYAAVAQNLTADVQRFVQKSPYPTLTSADNQAKQLKEQPPAQQLQKQQTPTPPPTAPKTPQERLVGEIVEQERVRQLLSISHLEANLMQESKQETKQESSTNGPNEDYWMMSGGDDALDGVFDETPSVPQEPPQAVQPVFGQVQQSDGLEKKRIIDQILREEKMRQLFQVEHIEKMLVNQPPAKEAATLKPEMDSYWAM